MNVLNRSDTVSGGTFNDMDFGDWLMQAAKVTKGDYEQKLVEAKAFLEIYEENRKAELL